MTGRPALAHYARDAAQLCPRYDSISSEAVLAPVRDLLPCAPARCLDVGAGSGRDAAWLIGRGHEVTAAEPTPEFRAAIAEAAPGARVVDAALPELAGVCGPFDLLLICAVWHHIDPGDEGRAFRRIGALLAPGGLAVLSLRHGEALPERGVFAVDPDRTALAATGAGLRIVRQTAAPSQQDANIRAGVTWTWLAFQKGET